MLVEAEELVNYAIGTSRYIPANLKPIIIVGNEFWEAVGILSLMNSCEFVAVVDATDTDREVNLKARAVKANALVKCDYNFIKIFDVTGDTIDEVKFRRTESKSSELSGNVIFFTSGTTGKPKAVKHNFRNMMLISKYESNFLNIDKNYVLSSSSPLSFTYGFGVSVTIPVVANCRVLFPSNKDDHIQVFNNCTVFATTPTKLKDILRKTPEIKPEKLKYILSAGEKLTLSFYNVIKNRIRGTEVIEHYGTTETFHGVLHNTPNQLKPGSIGKPLPCFEIKVIKDGKECNPYEVGELIVKGPIGEILGEERREWFRTGDLVYYDFDSFFWYVGRKDEIINVSGVLVSPLEIEEVLLLSGLVEDCVVYGFPDVSCGEKPIAEVVMKTEDVEKLSKYIDQNLSEYKKPIIKVVKSIRKSRRGKKIRKKELIFRAFYSHNHGIPPYA